jgi:mannosyltransferase
MAALAVGVFSHDLGASFWRDETYSGQLAARPLRSLIATVGHTDAPHGFYYFLLHLWVSVSSSEVWIRAFSVTCGTVTVLILAELARRRLGLLVATGVGLTLVCSPEFGQYAREARPYALACALTTAALFVLLARARPFDGRQLVTFVPLAVLSVYASIFSIFLLAGTVGCLVLLGEGRPTRRAALLAGGVLAIAVAPLFWLAARQTAMGGWISAPTPRTIAHAFARLTVSPSVAVFVIAVALLSLATAVASAAGRRPAVGFRPTQVPSHVQAVLWAPALGAVSVPAGLLGASFLLQPTYVPRYAVIALPFAALAIGAAIASSRPRHLFGAGLVVAALAALPLSLFPENRMEDLRAASTWVHETARPGDCIVYSPAWSRPGVDYYLRARPGAPVDVALTAGGRDAVTSADLYAAEGSVDEVVPALRACRRIWEAGYEEGDRWAPVPNSGSSAFDVVRASWLPGAERQFGSLVVRLWEKR